MESRRKNEFIFEATSVEAAVVGSNNSTRFIKHANMY